MLDERENSNSKEDDESVQTTRKFGWGRPKKVVLILFLGNKTRNNTLPLLGL